MDTSIDEWTYYTYNIENQLTIEEKGGIATYYTYNPVGELISKKVGEDEFTYDYTYEGQMNVFSDGATNAYYTYDSDFRRVEKKVDGVKTKFEYSNADVVAEYDTDNVLIATYNTPGIDDNLTKKIGENIYFYVMDGLGSVRNLLDSDETIQNTYDYLAFGAVYGTPTENVSNPFRFTGRRWDSESSLHFYRARMYNQLIGRFCAQDKLASSAFVNRYVYVANIPTNAIDPLGLYTVLFGGYHWAEWGSFSFKVVKDAEMYLNNNGERAKYYPENKVLDAITDFGLYVMNGDYERDHCPDINIVGYSCGTDSALVFAQKIENTLRNQETVNNAKIRERLFYLDFNWGTVQCTDCRHGSDKKYDYMPPERVKRVQHYVSTGIMTVGVPPLTWYYNGKPYVTPLGLIALHTHNLWEAWPDPGKGVSGDELKERGKIVTDPTWFFIFGGLIPGFVNWEVMAIQTVANTSGVYTADYVGKFASWPKERQFPKNYLDHRGMGSSGTNEGELGKEYSDRILSHDDD